MSIDVDDQQRINPLEPPYPPEVAETLRRMMPPDVEPLRLFRTVAHNPAVLERFRTIGVWAKMDTFRARVFLLATSTALLLIAIVVVLTFPKNF